MRTQGTHSIYLFKSTYIRKKSCIVLKINKGFMSLPSRIVIVSVSTAKLLVIAALAVAPTKLKAIENCISISSLDLDTRCIERSQFKTRPNIISEADKNFNSLPSCQEVNTLVDEFATDIKKIEKSIKINNKPNHDQPGLLNQLHLEGEASSVTDKGRMISSKDVFTKRFAISPVAREFYFNYLQSQEATLGSFDRPVLNFQFELNSNPEFSESVNRAISQIPNQLNTYTYTTNPAFSLSYSLSFENFYLTRSLKQQQNSAYYTFIDQSVTDSLDTVSNFYDLKSNILTSIIDSFQYKASADRVNRLKVLEQNGLNSRLDISRAEVTKTLQSTNLLRSKSAIVQSFEKLAGDFLFPTNFDTIISSQLYRGISTACWSKSPSVSVATAIKTNPSLIALQHQIESSRLASKSILSQNLPDLSISISYEAINQWGDINGTGLPNDYLQTRDVVPSVSFNWNIFDFGKTYANAKSQSYATEALRNKLTQSTSQLESELLVNFSDYISSTLNVIALTKASGVAIKNYINSLRALQVGILDETDVDNIFNQLTSNNSSLVANIRSRNNAAVAIAKLVQTEGFDNLDFNQFLIEWKKSIAK